jgi:hypothetical protein
MITVLVEPKSDSDNLLGRLAETPTSLSRCKPKHLPTRTTDRHLQSNQNKTYRAIDCQHSLYDSHLRAGFFVYE